MSGRHALDGQRRDNARAHWHRLTTTARDTWTVVRLSWLVLTILTTRRATMTPALDRGDPVQAPRPGDAPAPTGVVRAGAKTPTLPNPVISRHALPRVAGGAPVPPGAPEAPARPGAPVRAAGASLSAIGDALDEHGGIFPPAARHPWVTVQPPPGTPLGSLVQPLTHPLMPGNRVTEYRRPDAIIAVTGQPDGSTRTTIYTHAAMRHTTAGPILDDGLAIVRPYVLAAEAARDAIRGAA